MVLPVGALLAIGLVRYYHVSGRLVAGFALPDFGGGSDRIAGLYACGAFSALPNLGIQNINGKR
jgi:hypothetical protein